MTKNPGIKSDRRKGQLPPLWGMSLVEMMIATCIFAVVVIVIVRTFQTVSLSNVTIHNDTKRASLMDYIETQIKAANFYDVFGIDSNLPSGSPAFTGPPANNWFWRNWPNAMDDIFPPYYHLEDLYWTNWNTSRMRQILLDIDQRVKAEGYTRWGVLIYYYQRRAVRDAKATTLLSGSDLVGFYDSNGDGIDDNNPEYRFLDKDGDGFFFSTFTDTSGRIQSEIPNMPIKVARIFLFKGSQLVNKTNSFELTPGGLSGQEIGLRSTNLWAVMSPVHYLFFQDSALTHNSLRMGLPGGGFFRNINYVHAMANPIQVDLPDSNLTPTNPGHRLSMSIKTTPGGSVICRADNDPATETSIAIGITGSGNFPVNSDAFTAKLMRSGATRVVCYAERNGNTSPRLSWDPITDRTPPILFDRGPANGSTVATRTPNIFAVVRDTYTASEPGAFGISINSISMATTASNSPSSAGEINYRQFRLPALEDPTNPWRDRYKMMGDPGLTALFVDTGTLWLPYIFNDGQTVHMRVEYGDDAGYKAASQWSFLVSLPPGDTAPPQVHRVSPVSSGSLSIPQNSPLVFDLSDPESGVNPYSVQVILNGTTVLSTDSGSVLGKSLSNYSDPTGLAGSGGFRLTFQPPAATPYPLGLNTVQIQVQDWKNNSNDTGSPHATFSFTAY